MTEAQWWDACTTKPVMMLRRVRESLSPRKRQLLACGLCRLLPNFASEPWCTKTLVAGEQLVEGQLAPEDYQVIVEEFRERRATLDYHQRLLTHQNLATYYCANALYYACTTADVFDGLSGILSVTQGYFEATSPRGETNRRRKAIIARQCDMIRELAFYPLRRYARMLNPREPLRPGFSYPGGGFFLCDSVRAIAITIQAEQAFDRLPILADSLEDAGLTDEKILSHLRSGQTHYRGCWALDLVLGRS